MAYDQNYGQPRSMMGGPQNNNPRTQDRSYQDTTNGPTLFNNKAGKFLSFNHWNKTGSIEIGTMAPGSQMTWEARKSAEKFSQSIGFGDLCELADICEEVRSSLKNAGTFTSVGIRVGVNQDAMVEINNGSTLGLPPGIYLVIYKNLDSGNRTTTLDYYPFCDVKVLRGYDHNTGTYKEDISKIGEFKKFTLCVQEAARALTMATAHSVTVGSRNDRLSQFRALAAITGAMGIDMGAELKRVQNMSRNSGGGGRNSYGNNYNSNRERTFENSNRNDYSRQQQIMSTLDDPVDISLPMGELSNVDMGDFN